MTKAASKCFPEVRNVKEAGVKISRWKMVRELNREVMEVADYVVLEGQTLGEERMERRLCPADNLRQKQHLRLSSAPLLCRNSTASFLFPEELEHHVKK